jgi:hypothetical protein
LGSYSFNTALTKISTNCSSNPAAFTCYPHQTYLPSSPDTSLAIFSWTISSLNSYTYTISSSSNPFAPSFANITLILLDGNQYTERFTFSFTMANLPIIPSTNLVPGQTSAATCYFNSTVLTATLWTRVRATYPANITSVAAPTNASASFAPWPFRADVVEVQKAGAGVPDCRDYQGRPLGDFETAGDGECGCWYSNYGLGNGTTTRRR